MRWRRGAGRGQVEDRRGLAGLGRGGPLGVPIGGGLGGIALLVVVAVLFLGGSGGSLGSTPGFDPFPSATDGGPVSEEEAELADFVGFVVDDVQDSWARAFAEAGEEYVPTTLVLFTGGTSSGCGAASSATGPFYCPADGKVYLDLGFFRELSSRFGAPGDFAQAYVIAHEFGHHVQNVLGISHDVRRAQQEDPGQANALSVKLELQADCFAGVWAHSAYDQNLLEPGDLEEGLGAAAAIGDDRLQEQAGRGVAPETWTHGSSEQRVRWFQRGFESGDPNACDTFGAEE